MDQFGSAARQASEWPAGRSSNQHVKTSDIAPTNGTVWIRRSRTSARASEARGGVGYRAGSPSRLDDGQRRGRRWGGGEGQRLRDRGVVDLATCRNRSGVELGGIGEVSDHGRVGAVANDHMAELQLVGPCIDADSETSVTRLDLAEPTHRRDLPHRDPRLVIDGGADAGDARSRASDPNGNWRAVIEAGSVAAPVSSGIGRAGSARASLHRSR
jgi:hypothetical protein